jgi:hypothetical protein
VPQPRELAQRPAAAGGSCQARDHVSLRPRPRPRGAPRTGRLCEQRSDFKQLGAKYGGHGKSFAEVSRHRRWCDLPGATDGVAAECCCTRSSPFGPQEKLSITSTEAWMKYLVASLKSCKEELVRQTHNQVRKQAINGQACEESLRG